MPLFKDLLGTLYHKLRLKKKKKSTVFVSICRFKDDFFLCTCSKSVYDAAVSTCVFELKQQFIQLSSQLRANKHTFSCCLHNL